MIDDFLIKKGEFLSGMQNFNVPSRAWWIESFFEDVHSGFKFHNITFGVITLIFPNLLIRTWTQNPK